MQNILYFFVSIIATTAGSMTGMGGGVIIKPVLDVLHNYDAATINLLSSITVFAMSLVSVGKQIMQKAGINFKIALPLAFGSIAGGSIGQKLLSLTISALNADRAVIIIQNIVLAILIILVFFYMINKNNMQTFAKRGIVISLAVGAALGFLSSFLGIGGGPINVALLIFIFSFDTKTAMLCSIITILFSQVSKLVLVICDGGFERYNLSMLLPMVIGAVLGGFAGAKFNRIFSEKTIEYAFNGVQILVFIICIFNITRSLMLL